MKKTSIILFVILGLFVTSKASFAQDEVIKIEVPASVDKVDIKYQNDSVIVTERAVSPVKNSTEKTVEGTKSIADKTVEGTKNAAKKTAEGTKKITKKTVEVTKNAAKKTAEGTKNIKNKTVEGTRDLIDDINTPREITAENLQKQASITTLKNEKKALKSAYNSRIKDIKAKIKATEQSTLVSDVQKQNKIYTYEKQIADLEQQRDSAIKKYDAQLKDLKSKK